MEIRVPARQRRADAVVKAWDRFIMKFSTTGEADACWLWTASCDSAGRGQIYVDGTTMAAHTYSYEFHCGPVPDHGRVNTMCGHTSCVNPAHMEVKYANSDWAAHARVGTKKLRSHCSYGHEYTEENEGWYGGNRRYCRQCRKINADASMLDKQRRADTT